MVDYAPPSSYQFPTRTPIAQPAIPMSPRQDTYAPSQYSQTHARRRTSSSGVFPVNAYRAPQYQPPPLPVALDRQRTNSSSGDSSRQQLQRSASAVSSASSVASSYVATLRRQKATVWCEKAQPEDARLIAAQRAARERAAREVVGSSASVVKGPSHGLGSGSSSTTSLRGHHKLGKSSTTVDIGTTSLVSRPPPRLSATEATGDSSDEDDLYMTGRHRRSGSGSGRSSFNSNHRSSRMYSARDGDIQRRTSRGSTGSNSSSKSRTPPHPNILEETSPEVRIANSYFEPSATAASPQRDKAALKRSGSVDEGEARTMTMSGLRLVVANPD